MKDGSRIQNDPLMGLQPPPKFDHGIRSLPLEDIGMSYSTQIYLHQIIQMWAIQNPYEEVIQEEYDSSI